MRHGFKDFFNFKIRKPLFYMEKTRIKNVKNFANQNEAVTEKKINIEK